MGLLDFFSIFDWITPLAAELTSANRTEFVISVGDMPAVAKAEKEGVRTYGVGYRRERK